jgi:hypothetical protein
MCDIILSWRHEQQKMMKNIRMFRDRQDVSMWLSLEVLSIILLESEQKKERIDRVDERKN